MLDDEAAASGANFLSVTAFEAAKARRARGKGVAERTFNNMLSSQAMCFNIFAPLARDLELAARVLGQVIPGVREVAGIEIEYTPSNDIFDDQTGRGGVDCDVLIDATLNGGTAVIAIETKLRRAGVQSLRFLPAGPSCQAPGGLPGRHRARGRVRGLFVLGAQGVPLLGPHLGRRQSPSRCVAGAGLPLCGAVVAALGQSHPCPRRGQAPRR